ncbi:BglG family transcription antiterminator [Vagococcus salmoninarum]|uniref:BglG family transcription antiterminator n=1 Tax=Vagococcus salmoninarum TaxID=2739 RepID=UPI003F976477
MSLTNKWYQILNILLVKRQVASDELGQMTNLSSQTLKKNIELLNEQLAETAEITHNKKEFELQISNLAAFQTIMTGKLKKETDFNSSGKRMAYILKSLINTGDFVLIDDLSEVLQVSRGTVNKDIKAIKKQIMDFGVSLQGVPNKGIQIVGDEFNLRLIILQGVYDFYSDEYPLTEETKKWADGLAKYYKLDQSTLALLKKVIAISIARILNKLPMNEPISYYNNFEYNTDVMQDFMIFLEKEYLLTLGKYDQDFISFPINTRTTAMVEASHMAQYEIGVREVFDDMMAEIRNNFITELDDEELFEILKYHLMFMLNRIIFHVELFDLFMAEIQLKYPFSFELAKVAVSVIETKLMIPMNPIEASYLTISFELVLNKKTGDAGTKKVAIVCSTGRGTAALIHRQLKEVLGTGIEIVQYSETDYQELATEDYLAIFSTLPLPPRNGKPVIQITNLFDNQLLIQEWKRIDEQLLLTNPAVDFSFQILDPTVDYLTNVRQMVDELIAEGKLAAEFLPLWQEREKRQRTIFDQGIGFPHTINKGSQQIVFRIGVLPERLIEDNQYVQLVFLVGIPEYINPEVEKLLMEVYDLIFSLGQKTESITEISQLQSRQELLGFLTREEFI